MRSYGWDGVLLEVEDPAAWFVALVAARERGELVCTDIVPAAKTVLVRGTQVDLGRLERLAPGGPAALTGREVSIPVEWGGEDYAEVAEVWGQEPRLVLAAAELRVAFCGFMPGFAYLTGLPPALQLPRRATPRVRVPSGSLALAGPYAGIYPRSSPGGWNLVGRTEAQLFDLDRDPPALLQPGDRVRLVDA